MTSPDSNEVLQNQSGENSAQKPEKKSEKKSATIKLVVIISLIVFGYFGVRFAKIENAKRAAAKSESKKLGDENDSIFDFEGDYKNQDIASDLSVNELKEKGAEFIYQMLLRNQAQLDEMRTQIQRLDSEILRNKSQERLGKMVLAYVNLRQKFFAGEVYQNQLRSFEVLASLDSNLSEKTEKLKILLPQFVAQKALSDNFSALIPSLIAAKNYDPDSSLLAKIRHNFSKLIVVRKIDGENLPTVDAMVVKIEKSLASESYQEALNAAVSLDSVYHGILKDFLEKLSVALEVKKIDSEIMNYLQNLS